MKRVILLIIVVIVSHVMVGRWFYRLAEVHVKERREARAKMWQEFYQSKEKPSTIARLGSAVIESVSALAEVVIE